MRGRARAQALRPTLFIGVPRVFDKVYAGVQEKLAERTVIARVLFRLAFFFKQRALLRGALWDTVRAAPTPRARAPCQGSSGADVLDGPRACMRA